jgi:hypothetical protein
MQDSILIIITVSTGSLLGSIILVTIIDYVPRKKMLAWSFLGLAVLFAIAGGCLFNPSQLDLQALKVTLYITVRYCATWASFPPPPLYASTDIGVITGPNTLIFIVSCIQYNSTYFLII